MRLAVLLRKLPFFYLFSAIIIAAFSLVGNSSFAKDDIFASETCSQGVFNLGAEKRFPTATKNLEYIFDYLHIFDVEDDKYFAPDRRTVMEYFKVSPEIIEDLISEDVPSKDKLIAYYRPLLNEANNAPNYFRDDLANNNFDIKDFTEINGFVFMIPKFFECLNGINSQVDKYDVGNKINISALLEQYRKYSSEYLLRHEKEVVAYSDKITNSDKISVYDAFNAYTLTSILLYDDISLLQLYKEEFQKKPELKNKILKAYAHAQQVIAQINNLNNNGQKCMISDNDKAIRNKYINPDFGNSNDISQRLIPTNGIDINFIASFDVDAQGMPHNITFEPKVEGKYFEGGDSDAEKNIAAMTENIKAYNYVPGLKDCKPYAVRGKVNFDFKE